MNSDGAKVQPFAVDLKQQENWYYSVMQRQRKGSIMDLHGSIPEPSTAFQVKAPGNRCFLDSTSLIKHLLTYISVLGINATLFSITGQGHVLLVLVLVALLLSSIMKSVIPLWTKSTIIIIVHRVKISLVENHGYNVNFRRYRFL